MNAFESLIASLMEREGFWVRSSYKVRLQPAEKVAIGRPSAPRWEIDLLAYSPARNELRIVECKSYLDSVGVQASSFGSDRRSGIDRFKLFNDKELRRIVLARAVADLESAGLCRSPNVILCLAAGKVRSRSDEAGLSELFARNGWLLFTDKWIRDGLHRLSEDGYENSAASIVTKLMKVTPP